MILLEFNPESLKEIFLAKQDINRRTVDESDRQIDGFIKIFDLYRDNAELAWLGRAADTDE